MMALHGALICESENWYTYLVCSFQWCFLFVYLIKL